MTPLKFRVFDPATGKMSIDITLELLCMQAPTLNESLAGLLYKGLIVMQSTGLFDKNGLEIYEGDIVRREGSLYPVVYANAAFRTGDVVHADVLAAHDEVIGNIHENPNLLPQQP